MRPRRAWYVLRHTRLSVCDAEGNWRRAGQREALWREWRTDRERRKYLRAKHRAEASLHARSPK